MEHTSRKRQNEVFLTQRCCVISVRAEKAGTVSKLASRRLRRVAWASSSSEV
jgi:hypothetical protein